MRTCGFKTNKKESTLSAYDNEDNKKESIMNSREYETVN